MAKKIKTLDGFSSTSDSSGFRTRDAGALFGSHIASGGTNSFMRPQYDVSADAVAVN